MEKLAKLKTITRGKFLAREPMSRHTTYGIGGPVLAYIVPKDVDDLATVLRFTREENIPIFFAGSGSNLLVSDSGYDGLVISLEKTFDKLNFEGPKVTVEAGVKLVKLVKETIKRKLSGLEGLVGVPGTVGGALKMNAGAFGNEISTMLINLTVMTLQGTVKTYQRGELIFNYRYSSIPDDEIIVSALLQLEPSDVETIQSRWSKASQDRKTSQPLKVRSAGSVFKNPTEGKAAGYLIDQAGLKGTRVGDVEISAKHANFFFNRGNAKAVDMVALIRLAQDKVYEKFGIKLELEIKTLGFKSGALDQ
ncbi:MAG: UDP-N-acetylmuramate dehydrogenase [Fidelibacterota bacterium]